MSKKFVIVGIFIPEFLKMAMIKIIHIPGLMNFISLFNSRKP